MGLLYYFESTVDFHGMNQKDFFKLWSKHDGEAAALFQKGIMKYAFKVHVTHWSCALQEGTRSRSFRRVALNWVGLITPLIVAVLNLNLIKVILFSLNVWFKINVGRQLKIFAQCPKTVLRYINRKWKGKEARAEVAILCFQSGMEYTKQQCWVWDWTPRPLPKEWVPPPLPLCNSLPYNARNTTKVLCSSSNLCQIAANRLH